MEVRTFRDSEVIVEEGAEGNEFYVIQQGTCNCYKRLPKF
jgi:CRP-like cAMP-binding protein